MVARRSTQGNDSVASISLDLRVVDVSRNHLVSIDHLERGKRYHFCLKKQPCREGVYESQSKIKINEFAEWLVKLKDGTLLLECQIMAVHPLSVFSAPIPK